METAFPTHFAMTAPKRPAVIMAASGETLTYGELETTSNQLAHVLRARGLTRGDHVAMMIENSLAFFQVAWACLRSGLYFTPINTRLTAEEAAYIVRDSGARALIVSARLPGLAAGLKAASDGLAFCGVVMGEAAGYERVEPLMAQEATTPIADPSPGASMIYSSGTTGRPKGVKHPLPSGPLGQPDVFLKTLSGLYGWSEDTVYLCPAPVYHGAGLWYTTAMHKLGATAVVMEKFTPEGFLEVIQKYRVTDTQVVPTMLVRLLKLPEAARNAFDLSSLKSVIHSAAPCPIPIKERVIDWLGPIIFEYYAATEGNGYTWINSADWLAHRGSVGKAVIGKPHIVDDAGDEAPPREPGFVYFEGMTPFSYHNDPAKTEETRHAKGWTTTGDIGYLDEAGYLYLTDRKAFTIISGGVNIYPQEIENLLTGHPDVMDVAVFGVPDDDFGEQVKAVVQLVDPRRASPELGQALIAFCRTHLAAYKCPKSVDFSDELPRAENGKLYKRLLRERYWSGRETRII